jgi:hypothetical protein
MAVTDSTPIGARFGLLTVADLPFKKAGKQHHYHVHCKCDCGGEKTVQCYNLTKGYTTSCGCEHRRMLERRNTTHGKYGTPTYISWQRMLARCTNPNEPSYENYGGRGVMVCDRWMRFENFVADMGDRPDDTTIDRFPDVHGNYEPSNCRWATDLEQANNTRKNLKLEHDGRTMTGSQWARELGINQDMIYERIKRGWTVSKALTTPPRKTR